MTEKYKNIHIGKRIKEIVKHKEFEVSRACTVFNCSVPEVVDMYTRKSLDSQLLLKWCKLLDYNFFMFYHTHLQLYRPSASTTSIIPKTKQEEELTFRKNLYSPEVKAWILGKIQSNELDTMEIVKRYNIPKTTLYRWRKKQNVKPKKSTEAKKKAQIKYKDLYADFINELEGVTNHKKEELIDRIKDWENRVPFRELEKVNNQIKETLYSGDEYPISPPHVRSYDKEYILYILSYQKKNNLSNLKLSQKFKLSRTTIAKWKKLFNVNH